MKVLCKKILNPITKEDRGKSTSLLKTEKEYVILSLTYCEKDGFYIYIQTEDHNEPRFFSLDGFEFIDQKTPSSWITVFSESYGRKVMTILPESWNYESFFDDIENEEPKAVELFNLEAEKIYKEVG